MKVTYFDVFSRQRDLSSLNESVYDSSIPTKNFDLYMERYKNTKDINNLLKAIRECSNAKVANDNIRTIFEIYSEMENGTYDKNLLEKKIINDVIPYTNNLNSKDYINTPFYEAIRVNNVADRLHENHNMIKKIYNYDAYERAADDRDYSNKAVMYELCSIIDKTNLPVQGKIVTALEEYSLSMEKMHKSVFMDEAVLSVSTYFTANKNANWERIQNTLRNSLVLEFTNFTDDNGLCHISSPQEFDGLIDKCFISPNPFTGAEKYGIMTRSMILGGDEEFASDIISKIPGEVKKSVIDKNPDNGSILSSIRQTIDNNINQNDYIIKITNNQDIKRRLTHLNYALEEASEEIDEAYRILNTPYNTYCVEGKLDEITGKMMTAKQIFDKGLSKGKTAIDAAKDKIDYIKSKIPKIKYEPKNVITLIIKADKALADKFKRAKIAGLEKVNSIRSKIFKEGYVYDFIAEDGTIDVLMYTIETDNVNEVVNYVDDEITRYLNEQVLNGTGYRTYYVCSENQIDIHMTTDQEVVELSESDIEESKHYLSESTIEYIYELTNIEEDLANTHYATLQETIDFFTNNPDRDLFEAYCGLASIAGIDVDTIDEIGMYISTENTLYADEIDRIVSEYKVDEDIPLFIQLEAIDLIADLIVEGEVPNFTTKLVNPAEKLKNKWKYKKYKMKKPGKEIKAISFSPSIISIKHEDFALLEMDKDKDKKPIKKDDKNSESIGDKVRDAARNAGNAVKDKAEEVGNKAKEIAKDAGEKVAAGAKKVKAAVGGALKEININNLQLGINALRKSAKDADAKYQNAARNADAAFNHFAKSVKELMVSDRREAIIKGSVIPSFHRCVEIGVGLIVVGAATGGPLIPAIMLIGGIGISKDLTKKERALLIDEIETDLDVLDKQLQIYESNGQLKKYRATLKVKKELQRQQARIQYNIRIGKDFIPGSSGLTTRKSEE